jgi:D-3-phosphoglycerate dehydrogenase / 2-oxoglutarate reductase
MGDRPVVFVTQPIDEDALTLLEQHADVVRGFGPKAQALSDHAARVDALLVRHQDLDATLFAGTPRLRLVQRVGIGVDGIDLAAAAEAGVAVFNTAGGNVHTVAEMTIALGLAVARQIPRWDAAVRAGQFTDRNHDPGRELYGKRWGIVGLGMIGQQVARIARHGLGMTVAAYHPRRDPQWITEHGAEPVAGLIDLMAECDVVSLHVPRTDDTDKMIGHTELAAMRTGAILVNVSRGGVVDETALLEVLRDGRLGGAAIDVFDLEPPPDDHPFFSLPNVVLSPHRGGRTIEATELQGEQAVRRVLDLLENPSTDGALNEALLSRAGR